jgi:hypothetical protein
MGLTDKLKDLKGKAEDAASEHNEQIRGAIQKAAASADQKTGGKYSEKIQQAGTKADAFVGSLKDTATPAESDGEQSPTE